MDKSRENTQIYEEAVETDGVIPARLYVEKEKKANYHYPMHWHDYLEFDYVIRGCLTGRINGEKIEIHDGDFFFVNSGEVHETDVDPKSRMSVATLLLSYDLFKKFCPEIDEFYFSFEKKEDAKKKVMELMQECICLQEEKKEYYELEMDIRLRMIAAVMLSDCLIRRDGRSVTGIVKKSQASIKRIIVYMEAHYKEEVSLSQMADEAGMAVTYFSRFFKKMTGETFYHYMNRIRVFYAEKELLNTDHSITEIALNNGFPNVKSFISCFSRYYHVTPAKYRRLL